MPDSDDIPPPPSSPDNPPGGPGGASADRTRPASPREPARLAYPPPPGDPRYEILGPLGAGGMGVVFKGRDRTLGRVVAYKVIRGDAGDTAASPAGRRSRERFEEEGRSLARLQHPNIVQIHDAGEVDGRLYLVMEYVDGGTLGTVLQTKAYTPRGAAIVVRTLALAVQAAHDAFIIHRDLKPANVLVAADGTLKIADFGLAHALDEAATASSVESAAGTLPYMAPEQVRGERLTLRVDVYALGAIFYRILVGKLPFDSPSREETRRQICEVVPVSPRVYQPAVPPDLAAVCLKCLEKEADRRYPSAGAVAADLDRYLAGRPTAARPVGPGERVRMWAARKPAVAALGVVGAIALLAGAGAGALAVRNDVLDLRGRLAEADRDRAGVEKKAAEYAAAVNDFAARASAAEQLAAPAEVVRVLGWRKAVRAELRGLAASPVAAANGDRLRDLAAAAEARIDLEEIESVPLPFGAYCLAVSPDGRQVAVGRYHAASVVVAGGAEVCLLGPGGTTRRAAVTDGLMTSSNGIRALGFSPDGRWLAVGSRGGQVLVWDTASDQPPRRLAPGHRGQVNGLGFTRDGARLVTASEDRTVAAWDTATWARALTLECPAGHVPKSVECTAATDQVLVGHTRGAWAIRAADLRVGQKLDPAHNDNQFFVDRTVDHLKAAPGDDRVVGSHNSDLLLYDFHARFPIRWLGDGRSVHAHDGSVRGVSVDRTGMLLASGGGDEYLKLWDATTGDLLLRLFIAGDSGILPAFDPASGDLLVAANERLVRYRVLRPDTVRPLGPQKGERVAVAFAGGSDTIATACWATLQRAPNAATGELAVWRVADGTCLARHVVKQTAGAVELPPSITADGAGTLVAGGMPNTDYLVWEWQRGGGPRPVAAPEAAGRIAAFLRFSPDGTRLWGLHPDLVTVRCVAWPDRAEVLNKADVFQAIVAKQISCTSLAGGRRWTAVGSVDATVKLIPAENPAGDWRTLSAGDRETVHAVALSPDESLVLAGTRSGRVLALDTAGGGTPVTVLSRHHDRVEALAFAPDGTLLATGGRDRTIRLWRRTDRAFRPLVSYAAAGPVTQLVFSPDGSRLAFVVEGQRAFNVWEIATFRDQLTVLGLGW